MCSCLADCPTTTCGDGCCAGGETYCDCPSDCDIACGDGCCSTGETESSCPADCGTICTQGSNVAFSATPSISSGSSDPINYGPVQLNNGLNQDDICYYCWVYASYTPGTAWFQYQWATPQTLWGFLVDTNLYTDYSCTPSGGRSVAGGDIQWWNGSSWVTDGTVSGQTDDWIYQFDPPVTTTRIRIYGAHATNAGGYNQNPLIYEWEVYQCN